MLLQGEEGNFIPKVGVVTESSTLRRVIESHLEGEAVLYFEDSLDNLKELLEKLHVLICDREPLEGVRAEAVMEKICQNGFCHLPLIVLTSSEALNWKYPQRMPDLALYKPFTPEVLKESVMSCVSYNILRAEKGVVLVVDDSITARQMAIKGLAPFGYKIEMAESIEEAKERIKALGHKLRLMVLDQNLGGKDTGLDLALWLQRSGRYIPIVMATSEFSEEFKKKVLNAGVAFYLHKPYDPKTLTRYVIALIGGEKEATDNIHSILLVEDSTTRRNIVRRGIESMGYKVIAVRNADYARSLIMLNDFSVVVSDIVLEGSSGMEMTSWLRDSELPEYRKMVLLYSSDENPFIGYDAFLAGASDFIKAPFTFPELRMRIGNLVRLGSAMREVVEKSERLNYLSTKDELTGLFNRRFFNEHFAHLVEERRRYNEDLAVLMIDLDGFKAVNDTFGHEAGDAILKEVANILKDNIRTSDIAVRFGGDEFLVILPRQGRERAKIVADRIEKALNNVEIPQWPDAKIGASIGIATLSEMDAKGKDWKLKDILIQADKLMYLEKTRRKRQRG